jgi:uncharacterized peroxidase-related enzyme
MTMPRVNPIADAAATPAAGDLAEIRAAFGTIPAMFGTVAQSPAALAAMWGAFKALGAGRLGAALGEQIAAAVADRNRCDYCLAAHTALGRKAGVSAEAMAEAQRGRSADPRTAAALAFAVKLVETRAQISDEDVAALRRAGFDDGEIVEIAAHVALNLFTNYVNVAFAVPVDFPRVSLTARAA